MQQILGYIRRAITEYGMIQNGDTIAVGVSGGKDSVALLVGLARVRSFIGIDFSLKAITLDNQFNGLPSDYSKIQQLCDEYGIPYLIRRTDIGSIVLLHDSTKALGCNKIALGHHYDDAVETFLMNLFHEGRIGCFSPVTYLSRKDLTMIRPLVFAPEREIRNAVNRAGLPVVKSACPVDGCTARQSAKDHLNDLEKLYPGITKRIFGAIRRGKISGW